MFIEIYSFLMFRFFTLIYYLSFSFQPQQFSFVQVNVLIIKVFFPCVKFCQKGHFFYKEEINLHFS